ncbi:MAG: zinc metalloprotease HtpX, partial [Veillonella sp.]|nr:zinc metalloprotease HtpX [Veillonella sp.]
DMIGGRSGMIMMFVISMGMNFMSYWYSDKIVLAQYNAQPVTAQSNPKLYAMVEKLTKNGNLPMPRVYIIPSEVPNAFATGRNPSHAAVAVTEGIQRLLTDEELEGVLAHELTHVKNRDTLISTIAAMMAGAISMIANILQFTAIFGRSDDREGTNPLALLGTIIIAPIAAGLIQMSISRTREFLADEGGGDMCRNPLALASALAKIDYYSKHGALPNASNATAHMFIINPMMGIGESLSNLFSTHPRTEERIQKLKKQAMNPKYKEKAIL